MTSLHANSGGIEPNHSIAGQLANAPDSATCSFVFHRSMGLRVNDMNTLSHLLYLYIHNSLW